MPVENALEVIHKGSVAEIPGFREGYFYVQGITSQYAVKAAGIKENDHEVYFHSARRPAVLHGMYT